MKYLYGFYNEDGELELTKELDESQIELLKTLLDYGMILESVTIENLGGVHNYPPYADCPECGKTCVLLNGIDGQAEYWCDNCGLDFMMEVENTDEED